MVHVQGQRYLADGCILSLLELSCNEGFLSPAYMAVMYGQLHDNGRGKPTMTLWQGLHILLVQNSLTSSTMQPAAEVGQSGLQRHS